MLLCSSSSWASLRCSTSFRVLLSSVTVLSRPMNSVAKLFWSSSSGSNSTVFKFFFGVTAAMRVKALVSLNKVSHCGSGTSEETEEIVNNNLEVSKWHLSPLSWIQGGDCWNVGMQLRSLQNAFQDCKHWDAWQLLHSGNSITVPGPGGVSVLAFSSFSVVNATMMLSTKEQEGCRRSTLKTAWDSLSFSWSCF